MYAGLGATQKRASARRRKLVAGLVLVGAGVAAFSYADYKKKQAEAQQADLEGQVARAEMAKATTEGAKQEALGRAIAAETRAQQIKLELAATQKLAKDATAKAIAAGQPVPEGAEEISSEMAMPVEAGMFGGMTLPLLFAAGVGAWWFFGRKAT